MYYPALVLFLKSKKKHVSWSSDEWEDWRNMGTKGKSKVGWINGKSKVLPLWDSRQVERQVIVGT